MNHAFEPGVPKLPISSMEMLRLKAASPATRFEIVITEAKGFLALRGGPLYDICLRNFCEEDRDGGVPLRPDHELCWDNGGCMSTCLNIWRSMRYLQPAVDFWSAGARILGNAELSKHILHAGVEQCAEVETLKIHIECTLWLFQRMGDTQGAWDLLDSWELAEFESVDTTYIFYHKCSDKHALGNRRVLNHFQTQKYELEGNEIADESWEQLHDRRFLEWNLSEFTIGARLS